MINLDGIRGIDYRHSAFSIANNEMTLRFFSNKMCEEFIRSMPYGIVKKRLSPASLTLHLAEAPYAVVQDYLKKQALETSLDPANPEAAQVFAGAINYASSVFANHLILGGAYHTNEDDKHQILEHLEEIARILVKYESKEE